MDGASLELKVVGLRHHRHEYREPVRVAGSGD